MLLQPEPSAVEMLSSLACPAKCDTVFWALAEGERRQLGAQDTPSLLASPIPWYMRPG